LTHLLCVDDVLFFYFCFENEGIYFENILQLYSAKIGMDVNFNKENRAFISPKLFVILPSFSLTWK
jgi:hypothetical protein